MTIRRKNYAEHIEEMKIEMENRKIFLQAAVDELNELQAKFTNDSMTMKDVARAMELQEIARNHTSWIESHKNEIKNYYKPVGMLA